MWGTFGEIAWVDVPRPYVWKSLLVFIKANLSLELDSRYGRACFTMLE